MHPLAVAPVVTQSLSHTATSLSLLGITAVSLALALFIRRRVPRLASNVSGRLAAARGALSSRSGGARNNTTLGIGGNGRGASLNPIVLSRAILGWIALLLFAVAGVAASGTFVGTTVLWVARLTDSLFRWIISLFPGGAHDAATIGFSLVSLLALWLGLHLVADVIEGRAHHGGRDWLVFAGPMLFTLVPGYFGQWSATAYAAIGAHVGPIVAHLV